MSKTTSCPQPPGCRWESRQLDGALMEVCTRCGQVRMDPEALAKLAARAQPVTTPAPSPPPPPSPPTLPAPPPPPSMLMGLSITPAPPPARRSVSDAPPPPRHTTPPLTPGAPPQRHTPAPPMLLRSSHTVIPWGDLGDDMYSDDLDETIGAPEPPKGLRSVTPRTAHRARPPEPAGPNLRAAPAPEAAAPSALDVTEVPSADERPTTLDDSRVPTEEAPQPAVGLRAAVSQGDEPAVDLRAAVTRHHEPGLGLSVDDTNLPHEGQPFLERERPRFDEPALGPALADADDLDIPWRAPRSPWLGIAAGVGVGLLALGVVAVAVFMMSPGLRSVAGLDRSAPEPTVAPSLAEGVGVDDHEIVPPTAEPEGTAEEGIDVQPAEPDPAPQAVEATTAAQGAPPPPVQDVAPEPEPAPEPAPAPRIVEVAPKPAAPKPKPAPTGYSASVRKGWDTVETNAEIAGDAFRTALDAKPGDAEASYGLGYAMLKLGQRNGARAYLCAAVAAADAGTKAEIEGILGQNDLSCE